MPFRFNSIEKEQQAIMREMATRPVVDGERRYKLLCSAADKVAKELKLELCLDFKLNPLCAQTNFQRIAKRATRFNHFLMCKVEAINVLALELEPMFWQMKREADKKSSEQFKASAVNQIGSKICTIGD